jgi:hypothetical protein
MDGKSIFPYSRDGFEKVFADELYSGRIIITGWAYDESVQLGYGSVVVGGQDHMEAENLLTRIREQATLAK